MLFELLESDIKTKIATDLGSYVDVIVMPENQSEFQIPFVKNKVSVCYKSSNYDPSTDAYIISQPETQQLQLVLQSRTRRGNTGIYKLAEDVKNSIVGYSPTHCGKIYLKSFLPENFELNIWTFTLTIECKTLMVEKIDDFTGPAITQITFQ